MTAQPPTDAGAGPASDLEYDLAHEASVPHAPADPPAADTSPPVHVVTRTGDYDGDYSYDLAHDVPRT